MNLLRLPQVIELTGLSKTTIHRMEAQGRFPRRRQIGARAVAWNAAEIEEWIRSRQLVNLRCLDGAPLAGV